MWLAFSVLPVLAQDVFTPQHVAEIRTVANAVTSPDGKSIAYYDPALGRLMVAPSSGGVPTIQWTVGSVGPRRAHADVHAHQYRACPHDV